MQRNLAYKRILRLGLIISALRLAVLWVFVILDSSHSLTISSFPIILAFGTLFFPEAWLLGRHDLALASVIVITSFLVATIAGMLGTRLN